MNFSIKMIHKNNKKYLPQQLYTQRDKFVNKRKEKNFIEVKKQKTSKNYPF